MIKKITYDSNYDSSQRGSVSIEELRGVIQFRELIIQLIRRDIVMRFKRSLVGVTRTMLNPLGMMVVLTLVFSLLIPSIRDHPIYVLSGLLVWIFFPNYFIGIVPKYLGGGTLLHSIVNPAFLETNPLCQLILL